MTARAHRHRLLPGSVLALALAIAGQTVVFRSSPAARGLQQTVAIVNGHQAVAGEVLVRFADTSGLASVQESIEQIAATENVAVGRRGLRRIRSQARNVEQLLVHFRAQPGVVFAEPNYIVHAIATPNDARFAELWGLLNTGQRVGGSLGVPGADISAPSAWAQSTGSRAHVVGIIDSGIDYTHPDLAANIWSAPTAFTVTIGGVDITCPAGSHGFNAIARSCDPMDTLGHGTHVAGTAGAIGNNGIGVAGVNWTASLIAAKFLDDVGAGTTADAIDSIDFMIQVKEAFGAGGANIRVLNNSWGGGAFSTALRDVIASAAASDILFVAAAGNFARDTDVAPFYPASYDVPNVVAVAASTNQDRLWPPSNYGAASVDLAAPGEFVFSTNPGGAYGYRSGTSMAAPHVAGAAALVLSTCAYDTLELKDILLSTVDVVPALAARTLTGGRLNVDRAVRSCLPDGIPPEPAGLVAAPGDAQVALTWHSAGTATSYNLKRADVSGGPYLVIAGGLAATHYLDTGVVNGQTYYYVVSAVNGFGESADSLEASATPRLVPPVRPSDLQAVPGDGRIDLTWSASPGADSYRVKRSLERSGPYTPIADVSGTALTDLGLTNGTKYYYVVSAVNAAGEGKDSIKASAMPAPIPAPPGGLTAATGSSEGTIDLSWLESSWAKVYRIRRAQTIGGPYSSLGRVSALTFTDSGLKSGRRYYYSITALNESGESAASEVSAIAK